MIGQSDVRMRVVTVVVVIVVVVIVFGVAVVLCIMLLQQFNLHHLKVNMTICVGFSLVRTKSECNHPH